MHHFVEKQIFQLLFRDVVVQINVENMPARLVGQTFDCRGFASARFAREKKTERVWDALLIVPITIIDEKIDAIFDGVDIFAEQVAEFAVSAETFH